MLLVLASTFSDLRYESFNKAIPGHYRTTHVVVNILRLPLLQMCNFVLYKVKIEFLLKTAHSESDESSYEKPLQAT